MKFSFTGNLKINKIIICNLISILICLPNKTNKGEKNSFCNKLKREFKKEKSINLNKTIFMKLFRFP
jgi:hypothetical protein